MFLSKNPIFGYLANMAVKMDNTNEIRTLNELPSTMFKFYHVMNVIKVILKKDCTLKKKKGMQRKWVSSPVNWRNILWLHLFFPVGLFNVGFSFPFVF